MKKLTKKDIDLILGAAYCECCYEASESCGSGFLDVASFGTSDKCIYWCCVDTKTENKLAGEHVSWGGSDWKKC